MSAHPSEHRELVDRILGGELAESDAAARALLAACAECRSELERLRALDARLAAAARQARQDVAEARASGGAADQALVRAALLAPPPRERRSRPRPLVVAVLAAAIVGLLGLGLYLATRPNGEGQPEILLHGGSLSCGGSVGVVDDYDEFTWGGVLPPGGRYELRIHALEGGGAGKLLKEVESTEPRWIPNAQEKRALPDAIYWEVRVLDVTERDVERGWAMASRRSR